VSFAAKPEPYIAPKEKKVKFQRLAADCEYSALERVTDYRPLIRMKAFFELPLDALQLLFSIHSLTTHFGNTNFSPVTSLMETRAMAAGSG